MYLEYYLIESHPNVKKPTTFSGDQRAIKVKVHPHIKLSLPGILIHHED